jgi:hypothetical protein
VNIRHWPQNLASAECSLGFPIQRSVFFAPFFLRAMLAALSL